MDKFDGLFEFVKNELGLAQMYELSKSDLPNYIEYCLSRKENLDTVYEHALRQGDVCILERFPENFDFLTPHKTLSISASLCRGCVDVFDFLVGKGLDANVEVIDKIFSRPPRTLLSDVLTHISAPGCFDIAIKLLERGASITAGSEKN